MSSVPMRAHLDLPAPWDTPLHVCMGFTSSWILPAIRAEREFSVLKRGGLWEGSREP